MFASSSQVRADFDRIAPHSVDGWNQNSHYHTFLLRRVPAHCHSALDVGAGTGAFSRLLTGRSDHVLGIDLSPEMVRIARERSADYTNIEYRIADLMEAALPIAGFDCIVSLATLHHVPLVPALERLSTLLSPGGVLLILDLVQPRGLRGALWQAVAVPTNISLILAMSGRLRGTAESRAAWAEHLQHDVYPTLADVRGAASLPLPGARVRQHLLWRYSLVWRKSTPGRQEGRGADSTSIMG
jgi:SAM-dependent methyltransferase